MALPSMMNVFVINSGSSSIKYQLIRMPEASVRCVGIVDRIGLEGSGIEHRTFTPDGDQVRSVSVTIADHADGLREVARLLTDDACAVIQDPREIDVVGHRVVHGGEAFSNTIQISEAVKAKIRALFQLAPLHNPPNLEGIEVAEQVFKTAQQVAVFDTAFHQTMPPLAYRMAIPAKWYEAHGIRNYGFHGTSHKFVAEKAREYLNRKTTKLITIHLGNGCSMSAVQDDICVDTSMGMGPMNGLIMGTRAGDIDQSVIFYLVSQLGLSVEAVHTLLNRQSGMLGLTGTSDMRDVKAKYEKGDPDAMLAYEMYGYRIRKYVGAFMATLNGADALVFTAGVGENDSLARSMATKHMENLGIILDENKNSAAGKGIREINATGSPVKILVIPTNEELEIARQCYALLASQ